MIIGNEQDLESLRKIDVSLHLRAKKWKQAKAGMTTKELDMIGKKY